MLPPRQDEQRGREGDNDRLAKKSGGEQGEREEVGPLFARLFEAEPSEKRESTSLRSITHVTESAWTGWTANTAAMSHAPGMLSLTRIARG